MKVKLTKASDWKFREEREVTTLEELLAINDELIVTKNNDGTLDVTIYDDYVE